MAANIIYTPRVGDFVWLNQGDIHAAEILEVSSNGNVCLRIKGWSGERHWYHTIQLRELHPYSQKRAEKF